MPWPVQPCLRYADQSGAALPEWFATNWPCALPRSFTPTAQDRRRVCAWCGSGFYWGDGNFYRAQTVEAARLELQHVRSRMGAAPPTLRDGDSLATLQRDIGELRALEKQSAWQAQRFCSVACLTSSAFA